MTKERLGDPFPAAAAGPWVLCLAAIDDLDAIASIETESFPDPWSRAGLSSMLRTPIDRTWLALPAGTVHRDRVDGFVAVRFQPPEAEILRLAVRSPVRRRGLGSILLLQALDACHKASIDAVYLEVRRANAAALALYLKHGFRTQAVRRHYYPDGTDALVLSRITEGRPGSRP
ncbi:MAG TPA: ribosomal protein S18-alanine N-acetyltransferase [Thermoanaerobaculia bacterium]|nr:ribosomal protein S18-alanine N-acetyltransferase [Thermoanaerobaculia bacterium]